MDEERGPKFELGLRYPSPCTSGLDASVGANSDVDPTLSAAGDKFGGHVSITDAGGGAANSSYLSLGTPAALDMGDLNSALPVNIGQDATGEYGSNLSADIDDLAIWKRALSHDEIVELYADGSGTELEGVL